MLKLFQGVLCDSLMGLFYMTYLSLMLNAFFSSPVAFINEIDFHTTTTVFGLQISSKYLHNMSRKYDRKQQIVSYTNDNVILSAVCVNRYLLVP